ncbi:hypothetical protein ACQP1G_35955 [Nocardia sp. CA-107356]|uniref:hypothetical protein n=1 Tax=Nocardia sp. CA-107356 TaxID=3239972 RepID=UPI003D901F94
MHRHPQPRRRIGRAIAKVAAGVSAVVVLAGTAVGWATAGDPTAIRREVRAAFGQAIAAIPTAGRSPSTDNDQPVETSISGSLTPTPDVGTPVESSIYGDTIPCVN